MKLKYKTINTANYVIWELKVVFVEFYNLKINTVARNQIKDYKSIPIIVINYNQLLYLKNLIIFLQKNSYNNIIVIDNASTYEPLIKYYKSIENEVKVIWNKTNDGHRVFWKNKGIYKKYGIGYYVITDSDIVPESFCPSNFLKTFLKVLIKSKDVIKVGFSLKIDDMPDSNKNKNKIISWEQQFWQKKTKDNHFIADIDTTFALYRPMNMFQNSMFFKSIRLNKPFIAKHGGWYIDNENLTDEQAYYIKTTNQSSSWLNFNSSGKLANNSYKF